MFFGHCKTFLGAFVATFSVGIVVRRNVLACAQLFTPTKKVYLNFSSMGKAKNNVLKWVVMGASKTV